MEINQKNLKQSLTLIKEIAENKRQQGYYFEKLVKTCLKKIPPYSDQSVHLIKKLPPLD